MKDTAHISSTEFCLMGPWGAHKCHHHKAAVSTPTGHSGYSWSPVYTVAEYYEEQSSFTLTEKHLDDLQHKSLVWLQ